MRWMVFDDETAEAVVSQWRRGAAEILDDDPVDAALRAGGSSVVVLRSGIPGRLLVARFKVHAMEPEASGVTAPFVPPTIPSERKPWWRKLVA
jgi:hypothetical protein